MSREISITEVPISIIVERGETFYRAHGGHYRTDYRCTGPDGTVFSGQSSKATLLRLLRRRYGKVEITVVDGPTWRTRP